MTNIGFGSAILSDSARNSLVRVGFSERQIEDVEVILGNKNFKILEESQWNEDAVLRILAEVSANGCCVVKLAQSMIVAKNGDTLKTLGQKFINDRLTADKYEGNRNKMNRGETLALLEAKMRQLKDPIIPFLNSPELDIVSRKALILDASFLADYFKSVAKIKKWGRLPSFQRDEELIVAQPGLENSYYGNTLTLLVKAAIQIIELRSKQALEQKVEKIRHLPDLFSSRINAPKANKWIAALTAAVSMIGSSEYPRLGEYYVGADPTNEFSEKRAVGLVQQTFPVRLNLPYKQAVPLDVYGDGQLVTVRLMTLEKAEFEGAPAFLASFELYTKEGLTRFKALGSEKSQGLFKNNLTVFEVEGASLTVGGCSKAATLVLRSFAMRANPETFTR